MVSPNTKTFYFLIIYWNNLYLDVRILNMVLYEIEFVSYIFNNFTDFNEHYDHFVDIADNSPDLTNPDHLKVLFKWLENWGCSIFCLNSYDELSECLAQWYKKNIDYLPGPDKQVWELDKEDYNSLFFPYNSLAKISANKKIRGGRYVRTTIGPTGTSKIFYALRPKSLIPLDTPTRIRFRYDGSVISYTKYLELIKEIAMDLDSQCRLNGFTIKDLPSKIGRRNATIPALIDEYYWVTITNNFKIPDKNTLKKWAGWKEPGRNNATSTK